VLQVLELEGIAPGFVAGSSIGGLVGALHASGLPSRDLVRIARSFRFPRWFLPGGQLGWARIFPAAAEALPPTFEDLRTPLAVTAVDIEEGSQVVLQSGSLLPAVRATCALPGVLPPERIGGRWLVDGGVVNVLPVDVAWMADPDAVIAVRVGGPRARRMPQLAWKMTGLLSRLGRFVPNPATAKISFEILARAAEIVLERQTALSAAMTDPEVLIEPELGDMGLRDFDRIEEAVAAGRRAAEAALPALVRLLASPPRQSTETPDPLSRHVDPVCAMVIHPTRARATATHDRMVYYFCSVNCRDRFLRSPARYLGSTKLAFGPPPLP
jgi:NTE family protein